MEKKDLHMNMEFQHKHLKGRIVKIEDESFTVLWIDTKQIWSYPYDKDLLASMVVIEKNKDGKIEKESEDISIKK